MLHLKSITCITGKVHDKDLLEIDKTESADTGITQRRLNWHAHCTRHEDQLVRKIVTGGT